MYTLGSFYNFLSICSFAITYYTSGIKYAVKFSNQWTSGLIMELNTHFNFMLKQSSSLGMLSQYN